MDNLVKLLITAWLCFALAESSLLERFRRTLGRATSFSCYEERNECRREFLTYAQEELTDFDRFEQVFTSKPKIQELCRIMQSLYTCVDQWERETTCDYDKHPPESYAYGLIAGYICRESSQDLIIASMESPCIDSFDAMMPLIESVGACGFLFKMTVETGRNPEDVCPAMLSLGGCVLDAAQEKCGSAVHAVVEDEFNYFVEVGAIGTYYNLISDVPADFSCLAPQVPAQPARRSSNLFNFLKK